jgi:acetate kinase
MLKLRKNNMKKVVFKAFINYPHSPVKVLIIPTNEEVMIARDVVNFGNIK